MNKNPIRPYEMSVWTLGDSFIATLKAPGVENKGHVENTQIKINLDGTEELTFKIPMYYYLDDQYLENPLWYDLQHGLLMVGLRKIKTIFNKGTRNEKIYEFLVMEVTEEHNEDGSLYCNVTASGLAFQELGKKGNNIILSYEDLEAEIEEIEEDFSKIAENDNLSLEDYLKLKNQTIPQPNIQYYCDKVLKDTDWTYSIEMDWSLYDGYLFVILDNVSDFATLPYINVGLVDYASVAQSDDGIEYSAVLGQAKLNSMHLDWATGSSYSGLNNRIVSYSELSDENKIIVNKLRENLGLRRCDTLYEDDFVKFWEPDKEKQKMIPAKIEKRREKQRIIESSESNIYNLTQAIAETFEVYCRYKYYYDENYHIIKKQVVFYNQLLSEYNDKIDLTYAYGAKSITRTMDSNDICTKLIVKGMDDENSDSGQLNIMNASANKTGENYILNFDYLYETGSILKDQYEEIEPFEFAMAKYNRELKSLSELLNKYAVDINKYSSDKKFYENSIEQDREQINVSLSELKSLTTDEKTGVSDGMLDYQDIRYTSAIENSTKRKIDLSIKGIVDNTVHLFYAVNSYTSFAQEMPGPTTPDINQNNWKWNFVRDESNNITGITDIQTEMGYVGIKFSYRPQLASQNVINTYSRKLRNDQIKLEEAENNLDATQALQLEKQRQYDSLLEEKLKRMKEFDLLMGPALREGSWTPDSYSNYTSEISINAIFNSINKELDSSAINNLNTTEYNYFWDTELFDEEQKNYYEASVNLDKIYYPYVELTNNMLEKLQDFFIKQKDDDNSPVKTLYFRYAQTTEGVSFTPIMSDNKIIKYSYTIGTGKTFTQDVDSTITDYNASLIDAQNKLSDQILLYGLQVYTNTENVQNPSLSNYTDAQKILVSNAYGLKVTSYQYFPLGSKMILSFIKQTVGADKIIKPILLLIGAEKMSNDEINELIQNKGQLGTLTVDTTISDSARTSEFYTDLTNLPDEYSDYSSLVVNETFTDALTDNQSSPVLVTISTVNNSNIPETVFPRIEVPTFSLNPDTLKITAENDNLVNLGIAELQQYNDFYVMTKETGYYITIKPEYLVNTQQFNGQFLITGEISNAELSIYLDALEISKNNAYPQVSYEVDLSILNTELMHTAYNLLGRIAHINDYELKFENTLGYISAVYMNLDSPWEDNIEIQNYKTKFADLFTKIIASTIQMQSNVTLYNKAAAAFNSEGLLTASILQNSLTSPSMNLNLPIAKGKLTIDGTEGILAKSDNDAGVVLMTGSGIYCANEKNESGVWKWHTGITPKGINASMLTTGQLDTNLIRIFSGTNLRFQLNAYGLYAYAQYDNGRTDETKYVVHNSEGLFMTKKGMTILYDAENEELEEPIENEVVNRVEISWDGLILRNDNNKRVFYADNNGNLTLSGTIIAENGYIGGWQIDTNALTVYENNGVKTFAGMANGYTALGDNILDYNTGLYKVFWAGLNTDGTSRFYVDSNGNTFASSLVVENSLIASNIMVKGIPLEALLPDLIAEHSGLYVSALDGNIFYLTIEDEYEKEDLEFILSSPNNNLNWNNLNFTITIEDDEENISIITEDVTSYLSLISVSNLNYLTFSINYGIMSQSSNNNLTLNVINGSDVASINLSLIYQESENLNVIIQSDSSIFFNNGTVINKRGQQDENKIVLTAIVYKNGSIMDSSLYEYIWEKNGIVITGANNNILNITVNAGEYYKVFSDVYTCKVVTLVSEEQGDEEE